MSGSSISLFSTSRQLHPAKVTVTLTAKVPIQGLRMGKSVKNGVNFAFWQPQRISFRLRAVLRDDVLRECLELIPQRASFEGMIYTSQDKEDLY